MLPSAADIFIEPSASPLPSALNYCPVATTSVENVKPQAMLTLYAAISRG
jgi:hypothetical protein